MTRYSPGTSSPSAAAGGLRILAVDDDDMVLELLRIGLLAAGHPSVETAPSAATAIERIESSARPYDCIMLDIQMPGMDGIDLCRWIKSQETYRDTPVIMVTAMSDRDYIQRAFAAGAMDYVTKPFDTLELTSRVGMAARLVQASTTTREAVQGIRRLRNRLDLDRRIPFDQPVPIHGVRDVIGYSAMQNYLQQLSRAKLFTTTLLAFHAEGFEALYNRLKPSEYYFLLTDAAEALSAATLGTDALISYAGKGSFIAALQGTYGAMGTHLADRTNRLLANSGALQGMDNTRIEFGCSAPVRMGLLFSRSPIARAMETARTAFDHPPLPSNLEALAERRRGAVS